MPAAPSDFVAFLLERLEPLGGVTVRQMFGGSGLFREGAMFGLIADDVLYLKVDDTTQPDFAEAGSLPFSYQKKSADKPAVMKSYWEVPPNVLTDADTFRDWSRTASAVAIAAKAAKG